MTNASLRSRTMTPLRRLARYYGLQTTYVDLGETRQHASVDATLAVLQALGAAIEKPEDAGDALAAAYERDAGHVLDAVIVGTENRPLSCALQLPRRALRRIPYRLELENGEVWDGTTSPSELVNAHAARNGSAVPSSKLVIDRPLPIGYHRLVVEVGNTEHASHVIVAPKRCRPLRHPKESKGWGVFLPLYALRKHGDWGVGDFSGLRDLLHWTSDCGGDFVGTLPMLAAFLEEPCDPSPYSPVSRLFWNELFLDPEQAPEWNHASVRRRTRRAEHRNALKRLRARTWIDYADAMKHKRAVLEPMAEACFANDARRRSLEDFLAQRPEVVDYARFRATCERHGRPWQRWPARLRNGVIREGDYDSSAYRYRVYAQFLAERQLKKATEGLSESGRGVYLDLPLGVNPGGYDTWRERDSFLNGLSVGAPPDPFFSKGQNWGLPPLHPRALRERGYRYWRDCLHHNLQYAGVLRIDHIMAFHRLFCIPEGMDAVDGVYVQYPADEFHAVLALESRKRDCAVVGEDLGTVPDKVRTTMKKRNVARMYVAQFAWEGESFGEPSANCVASVNTHDTPSFASFFSGKEIRDRKNLGLLTEDEAGEEMRARAEMRKAIGDYLKNQGLIKGSRPDAARALRGLLNWLAQSPAALVLVNLEDLWLEERPQNVPGTSWECPNWRRKAALSFERFIRDPRVVRTLEELARKFHRVS